MSEQIQRHPITMKKVVCQIPGMDAVRIERDVEYHATDEGARTMDVYHPSGAPRDARTPAVVIVEGYSDVGYEAFTGCKFKDTGFCISWAQLMAASGLVAITYTNREPAAEHSARANR